MEAATAIVASATAARSDLAALDLGAHDEPHWLPPGRRDRAWLVAERLGLAPFAAAEDNVERALTFLGRLRGDLPPGTFVFVLSDFVVAPSARAWMEAVAHGWDVVPVVIQDPVWEQSFPSVAGIALPIADPRTGEVALIRLNRRQVEELRVAHERRLQHLLAEHVSLGLDPVVVGTSDPQAIDSAFIGWAELRRQRRWAR